MTDFANPAAAVSGGWIKEQTDRGASFVNRYVTIFSKPLTGAPGGASGKNVVGGRGYSSVDFATADTNALASLNGYRLLKYGAGSNVNKDGAGNQHVVDVT